MPKYEKLNIEEKECAEFLGLDPKKITQKEYKNIIDTLNAQKDNLNQASSSKSETVVEKRKINKNKVAMEKKIRFLQENFNAFSKSSTNKIKTECYNTEIANYLNPNSLTFCNFCNECDICIDINTSYDKMVKLLSGRGRLKR